MELIFISKKQKILYSLCIILSLCILYFVGTTFAIKAEIKSLESQISENDDMICQIETAQRELHNAAEALRQPYINDEQLASLLSTKWNELNDVKIETIENKYDAKTRIETLKKKLKLVEAEQSIKNKNNIVPSGVNNAQTFELTAYYYGTVTATGTTPTANRTIAVDPKVIPLGKKVYIEGYGTYIAEDTGGVVKGNIIDIYIPSKEQCIQFGRRKARAWIVE